MEQQFLSSDFVSGGGKIALNPNVVLQTITNAFSGSSNVSTPALELLRKWEREGCPGFLASLKQIMEFKPISEDIRLASAIVAKNAVGSSWRKTVDDQDWARISDEEKTYLKESIVKLLLIEPSEKISMQMAILIGNIARFDFPQKWPNLIGDLLEILTNNSPAEMRLRAALALKHTLFSLKSKVIVSYGLHINAVKLAMEEAKVLPQAICNQFVKLYATLQEYFKAFNPEDQNCIINGKIAKLLISSCTFALSLLNTIHSVSTIREFYEVLYNHSQSFFQVLSQSLHSNYLQTDYLAILSRLFFKIINCIHVSLEKHTMEFGEFLVPFVRYYTECFVTISAFPITPITKKLFPPSKLMKITQFITKILVCPILQTSYWQRADFFHKFSALQFLPTFLLESNEFSNDDISNSKKAFQELSQYFTSESMSTVISVILTHYMSLTKKELKYWEEDPEEFVREIEAQDTLRQSSEELLVALSAYNPKTVENHLNTFFNQLKQLDPQSFSSLNENILKLDAFYKAVSLISLVVVRSETNSAITDINQWYEREFKAKIESIKTPIPIHEKIVLFRILWILRKLAFKLTDANRLELLKSPGLIITCLTCDDIVISLQAVITIHSLFVCHKEFAMFSHIENRKEEPEMSFSAKLPKFTPTFLPNTQELPLSEIIKGSFFVLNKLSETENQLQIISLIGQLCTIIDKEDLRKTISHLLEVIRMLWTKLSSVSHPIYGGSDIEKETGGEVRLKKEIVLLLASLVHKLSSTIYETPGFLDVTTAILKEAIDFELISKSASLPSTYVPILMDEGFRLWIALLKTTDQITPSLAVLLPVLIKIITLKVVPIGSQLLEGYILLGGSAMMSLYGVAIFQVLNTQIVQSFDKEEIIQSLYCLETIIKMFPIEGVDLFKPTLQFIANVLYDKANDNKLGIKSKYIPEVISKFSLIISRIICQNPQRFTAIVAPTSPVQMATFLNNILQILLYEIQLYSFKDFISIFAMNSTRNWKILSLAMMIVILELRNDQVEYFSQALGCTFDMIQHSLGNEERRKMLYPNISRTHNCKLDEIFYNLNENDPLSSIDIISYFQQASQIYITRFGKENFYRMFDERVHPDVDKLLSSEDTIDFNSLSV